MTQVTKLRQTTESAAHLPALSDVPVYVEARKRLEALQRRLEITNREFAIVDAQARGQGSTTPMAEQADKLLAGGRVSPVSAPSKRDALTREREIITRGIFAATEKLDEVRGELSFAVCSRENKGNKEDLRAADAAATALFEALERNRVRRGRILGAGYQLLEGVMQIHIFPAATLLGNPQVSNYPAGQFHQWLKDRGIV